MFISLNSGLKTKGSLLGFDNYLWVARKMSLNGEMLISTAVWVWNNQFEYKEEAHWCAESDLVYVDNCSPFSDNGKQQMA